MRKIALSIIVLLALFQAVSAAEDYSITPIEQGIIDLDRLAELGSAYQTDILLYLGWVKDHPDRFKKQIKESTNGLAGLQKELKNLKLPQELAKARVYMNDYMATLKKNYTDIDKKSEDQINKEMTVYSEQADKYSREILPIAQKYLNIPDMPKNFDEANEDKALMQGEKDKIDYVKAVGLMKKRQFAAARKILEQLRGKYRSKSLDGSLISLIIDCDNLGKTDIKLDEKGTDEDNKMMEGFLNTGMYCPRLYWLFAQWRTLLQLNNYGVSNFSQIPNVMYINKKFSHIKDIGSYLREYKNDKWAKTQLIKLMEFPTIDRGDYTGNYNLSYWSHMFMDLAAKEEAKKKGK